MFQEWLSDGPTHFPGYSPPLPPKPWSVSGPNQPLSSLHSNTQINPSKTSTQDYFKESPDPILLLLKALGILKTAISGRLNIELSPGGVNNATKGSTAHSKSSPAPSSPQHWPPSDSRAGEQVRAREDRLPGRGGVGAWPSGCWPRGEGGALTFVTCRVHTCLFLHPRHKIQNVPTNRLPTRAARERLHSWLLFRACSNQSTGDDHLPASDAGTQQG